MRRALRTGQGEGPQRACPRCGARWDEGQQSWSCHGCLARARIGEGVDAWLPFVASRAPELAVGGGDLSPEIEGMKLELSRLPLRAAEELLEGLREAAEILRRGPRKGPEASRVPGTLSRLFRGASRRSWVAERLLAVGLRSRSEVGSLLVAYEGERGKVLHIEGELIFILPAEVWRQAHQRERVDRPYLRIEAASLPASVPDAERVLELSLALREPASEQLQYRCELCELIFGALDFHPALGACHRCAERHLGILH